MLSHRERFPAAEPGSHRPEAERTVTTGEAPHDAASLPGRLPPVVRGRRLFEDDELAGEGL